MQGLLDATNSLTEQVLNIQCGDVLMHGILGWNPEPCDLEDENFAHVILTLRMHSCEYDLAAERFSYFLFLHQFLAEK